MLLRIRADGGRKLAKKTGMAAMVDAKPDPYLIVRIDGKSTVFPVVDDVDAAEFRWGDDAVRDLPWPATATEMEIHVKDKDLISDHHIGAARVPLAPIRDALAAPGAKTSRNIDLDFADEKLKTKKFSGQITLTFECIDTTPAPAATKAAASAAIPDAKESVPQAGLAPPEPKPVVANPTPAAPEATPIVADVKPAAPNAAASVATDAAIAVAPGLAASDTPNATAPPLREAKTTLSAEGLAPLQPSKAQSQKGSLKKAAAKINALTPLSMQPSAKTTTPAVAVPAAAAGAPPSSPARKASMAPAAETTAPRHHLVRIQAVGGRNLAPKSRLERLVDQYPDPYITLVVGSDTRVYPVVDDVKTAEFTWGEDAVQEFEIPTSAKSIAVALHVKDKDLVLDHYIGGTAFTLDLETLLAAQALPDLVYTLEYDSPAFKTKAKTTRGEILLSFFLVAAVQTPAPTPAATPAPTPTATLAPRPDVDPALSPANAPALMPEPTPAETPAETSLPRRSSVESRVYKGSLQVIAHSADGIPIPPRKMLSLDRLADPYVLLKLGAASAELPQAKDGHDKPKWHNALHLFEYMDSSLVPWMDVLIYDKNLVFHDSYLAGARLSLADVLATVTPELPCVVTLPLNLDKSLQPTDKAIGTITLSLLYTPDDANRINWTGPSVGCIGFANLALSVTGDLVSPSMELVLDVSIRRHVLATDGFVTQSTDPVAGAEAVAWLDTALCVPYSLYLHEGVTKDKCPMVLFFLRDRAAILHDKPIALGHVNLLDVLGLHTTKHVVLLSQNSTRSGRAMLSVAVAPAEPPRGTSADFAATPGRLRVFLLGATLPRSSRKQHEKLRLALTAPATTGASTSVQTDTVDPTAHGALLVLNSVLELQYLSSHVAKASEFAPTLSLFNQSSKLLCSVPLPVLSLLEQHEHNEFTLELQHDASTMCVLSMALTVEPSTLPPETIAAVASAVDFGPGYLHMVVLQADAVVLDGGASITDLDPEVRVSIKPRYTKDKRVTSSAKTRPLEVVAPNPSWHEYLKLEFIPSDDPATLHVPPTVTFSLNEIKPPGEDSVMHVLGTADLPLAAFLPATVDAEPFATKVDLLRGGASVGGLCIVGIFESLTAPDETRKAVHAHARRLRTTTMSIDGVSSSAGRPGRFEVHLLHATGLHHPPHEPIACDVCVASAIDEIVRVESQPDESSTGELVWDRQLTLFTHTAASDYLRLDFFVRSIMIGFLKVPIATYSQMPRKACRELHDIVLKTKDKDARSKPQALLELAFFPDEALPTFAPTATRRSETGRLLLKLEALEPTAADLLEKKLALRCTLLYANGASVVSLFHVGTKAAPKVAYGDVLELVVPDKYTQHTSSLGTCPLLRLELINGSSAFGKEAVSSDDVAIQSLLFHPHMVLTKRLPLSTLGATPSCVGYARVQLVYIPSKAIEYFAMPDDDDDRSMLLPQRGVLSVRAIAGRNLEEVDALGEQDPYIQLRTLPRTYASTTPAFAQSAVCLNSGRHPVWNSPVFPLLVDDVHTTLLSIDVLDSGEEDHVPDALIGSSSVSLAALLAARSVDDDASRWSEGWFPIVGRGADAGTVRLEYRFIPDDDARLQREPPTQYTNCVGGSGTLHLRLLRARHLPCTPGMTPALRALVDASPGFCHVTRAEKKNILHPVFEDATSCALRWTANCSESVRLELHIVDVSAHVASASLPILARTTLDLAPFVIHPREVHQAWHRLRSSSNEANEGPSVQVALQFIPSSDSTSTPFAEPVPEMVSGQVHVKILEAAFRSAAVDAPSVHVELRTGNHVQARSTAAYVSPSDDYARSVWDASMLFDCQTLPEAGLPTLRFRVANAATSFGELEMPLFPFVLAKGHLCSAWYPLYLQHQLTAQLKVEVQFLRTQSTQPPPPDLSFLSIEVVEGRHLRLAHDGVDAQDPFVELTLLDHVVQTKPHVDGGRDPTWNETFEVPLTSWSDASNLPTLTISVRNADAKKHGAGVIGECHWVVPKDVLHDGKLRDVILKLTGASDGVDVRDDVGDGNGDIQLRLKRGKLPSVVYGDAPSASLMSAGETSGEAGRATNSAGILYLFSRAPPIESVTVTVATDAIEASPATQVSLADVGVVRVPTHTEALKRSLPHPATSLRLSTSVGAMTLSADYLRTVLATPLREFRDTYALSATDVVDLSLVYAKPVQGLLRVSCVAVDDVPLVPGTSYYAECRILRNSPWTKSPLVKAHTSTNLTWKTTLAPRELAYSNLTEALPPQAQCVLYAASGDESAVKVAYAQVSLLKYILAPGTLFPDDVVPLSCVTGRPRDTPSLHLAIGFFPTVADVADDNTMLQAVELAEGTAALKKAFLLLGGDATKPIAIDIFRAHALASDQCMHVLGHAAEAIGGLDKLFAAMDANKDGEISWEEYLDCMQTVHCLADAVLAKPDVAAATLDDQDDESDEDVVVAPSAEDEPADEPAGKDGQSASVSVPPAVPTPWATFEPIAPLPINTKGMSDADSDDDAPTRHDNKRKGPPPMIPVPKASSSAAFPSAPAAKAYVAKANVAKVASAPVVRVNEREIATWKVGDVAQWLEHSIELPQYITSFRDASVDGPLLLTLSQDDLVHQLSVQQPLHLRKLVAKIADLQDKYGSEPPVLRASSKHRHTSRVPKTDAARLEDATLHELGVHSIQRSKLDVKVKDANRKSKAATAIAAADRRHWNFEYTGAPAPEAPVSVVQRLSKVLSQDKSAFEGAMDDVLAQVGVHRSTPPLLRVPLITTTDEAVEILKQSMWRLGRDCVRAENDQRQRDDDAASDFGDAPDARLGDAPHDAADVMSVAFREFTRLENNGARWLKDSAPADAKLSRLKFQGGLRSLLRIDLSWHQFDELFRRLDRRKLGELTLPDFVAAFGDPTPGSGLSNDMRVVNEALTRMVERLDDLGLTLLQAWQAFDRDNSGAVSPAEFGTLVKFLTHVEGRDDLTKHQVFLMMGALDTSCDRQIQHAEFLRFVFLVWSHRLGQLQEYIARHEATYAKHAHSNEFDANFELVLQRKQALRRALRQNFSRPFRDAMRCAPVAVPGPFQNLLEKLHLAPPSDEHAHHATQVWQVLQGGPLPAETPIETPLLTSKNVLYYDDRFGDRKRPHTNELVVTKLRRQRAPERSHSVLRAPVAVALDQAQQLTFDRKTHRAYK
ncbi:hypothetical protein SPRG_11601 [Saprolegnia parasitica CBS 223.65]|uniref:Uncharacterized protein n=1 Tax=Saprolegnia parasitica (strain CBS 223.65) TaxID=695850 RepID=A0A067C911_SAPPC|nr:hypothetical protein SPRG_11601 [Saprolegnia parasitica CBS 223.65]KDO23287.1 hypothetical protein SPRG_11601 [Saprolegnia parasitica CBS 223.65]|eukprot:XP_012205941.1 hypothetical protein SPRG_11601 [Saprolegnia parasitica CBS 223.65]